MPNTAKQACTSGKFGRLHYYHGMLLTEEDCKVEQTYFREKMKLHNRLHGYGVVWGLEPGFALDCAGNEIIVCRPHLVPLDEKLEEMCQACKPLPKGTRLLIVIKYCEGESAPQPQYTSQCVDDKLQPQNSRVCEGYCVQVREEKDVRDCCREKYTDACRQNPKQDCPGLAGCCEQDHVIILGCITIPDWDCQEPFKLTEKSLDPCCTPRRVCTPCHSPQSRWEHQKQVVLREACVAQGWIDFSGVVGKSVEVAERYLESLDFKKYNKRSIDTLNLDELSLFNNAVCCASVDSTIILIKDKNEFVLFALAEIQGS
jgi:hypothetical protein